MVNDLEEFEKKVGKIEICNGKRSLFIEECDLLFFKGDVE